jgi:hypothetical protein
MHIFCGCLSGLCEIVPQVNVITEVYLFEICTSVAAKFAYCSLSCEAVLSGRYQRFRGVYCVYHQGKMEATRSSKPLLNTSQVTWQHIP